jgi:signal peptidase II
MTDEAGATEGGTEPGKNGGAGGGTATVWLWLSLAVLAADQATKWLVTRQFELYESVEVNPYLDLTLLHNTGAAFSFLADAGGWQRWFFITLGIVVSVVILFWLRRLPSRGQSWLAIGLSLVMGGALGNVIDRVHYGYVIDFIHVHYEDAYFPAFNVADSAITVGAICLIIDALFFSGRAGGEESDGRGES